MRFRQYKGDAGFVEKKMSTHVRLLLATAEGREMWSDCGDWSYLWCVYRKQLGTRCAVCECACGNVRMDAVFGEKKVSKHVGLLLATGEGGGVRSD